MENWYALRTKPNREEFVRAQLDARNIETYLPLWHPPHLQNSGKPRPFFPSYIFAQADLACVGVSTFLYLPGISRLIMCDGEPVRVEQAVIDEIRTRIGKMENSIVDAVGKPLARGDKVRITGGVFAGYEAIFDQRIPAGDRVQILIDFIQKRTRLTLERNFVEKQG